MTSSKTLLLAILAFAVALLTGCAGNPILGSQEGNPDVYERTQVMNPGGVVEATIEQVRQVQIGASTGTKTVGAAAGGAACIALTSRGPATVALVAGLACAQVGRMFASHAGQSVGNEIVIKLVKDATMHVIVQEKGAIDYKKGDKVLVLCNGAEKRIVARI